MPLTETTCRIPLSRDHPWPGPDYFLPDEHPYFHGREEEKQELAQRLERGVLTVVVGRAGLGKSSLVRAGLKPAAKPAGLEPVYLRLQYGSSVPPLQQVRDELNRALRDHQIEGPAFEPDQTLWEYFHSRQAGWFGVGQELVLPVLVFDQFEEIFTVDRTNVTARVQVEALWTELSDLVENRMPESVSPSRRSRANFPVERPLFKLVICLRHDYLAELTARRGQMPSVMQNHLLLRPFDGRKALEVVLGPGRHLLDPSAPEDLAEQIVRRVWREARQTSENPTVAGRAAEPLDDLRVEPALLSLFCQQLNEARKCPRETEPPTNLITAKLLETQTGRIFEDFYEDSFKVDKVAPVAEEVRDFIETRLIGRTPQGVDRRDSESLALVEPRLRPAIDSLVAHRRLLRVTGDEDQRVELIHDRLVPVVRTSFERREVARKTQEQRRKDEEQRRFKEEEERRDQEAALSRAKMEILRAQAEARAAKRLTVLSLGLAALLVLAGVLLRLWYGQKSQRQKAEIQLLEMTGRLADVNNEFIKVQGDLRNAKFSLTDLAKQVGEKEKERKAANEEISSLAKERDAAQSDIIQLSRRIGALHADQKYASNRLQVLTKEFERLQIEKRETETRLADSTNALNTLTQQIARLNEEKEKLDVRNQAIAAVGNASGIIKRLDDQSLEITFSGSRSPLDLAVQGLKEIGNVKVLDLRFTQVTDSSLEFIPGLAKLGELDLSFTTVTDRGVRHLGGITSLSRLSLRDTLITQASLPVLSTLTNLRSLNLSRNRLTDAEVNALQGKLPACEIIYSPDLLLEALSKTKGDWNKAIKMLPGQNYLIADSMTFHNSPITDAAIGALRDQPGLQSLTLSYCSELTDF